MSKVRGAELAPLVDEEVGAWRDALDWDYQPSADLVLRYVNLESLDGHVLLFKGKPIGYLYYVVEERKSVIGGLFVSAEFRNERNENLLLEAALAELYRVPGNHRVEAQLMLLSDEGGAAPRSYPRPEWLSQYARVFMDRPLAAGLTLAPAVPSFPTIFEPWTYSTIDESAGLISRAYEGHIDALINDLYRTPGGSRKFLENIVNFPGCGAFDLGASFLARDAVTRRLMGVVLASRVSATSGHLTQVCVGREGRGRGVGYELMRRSMEQMTRQGLDHVSLTVTAENPAITLYERMGFHHRRNFSAVVWEGF